MKRTMTTKSTRSSGTQLEDLLPRPEEEPPHDVEIDPFFDPEEGIPMEEIFQEWSNWDVVSEGGEE